MSLFQAVHAPSRLHVFAEQGLSLINPFITQLGGVGGGPGEEGHYDHYQSNLLQRGIGRFAV